MHDRDWKDPAWAERWDADHLAGNPVRQAHLDVLLDLARHLGLRSFLDLGCGSGVVAELLLDGVEGSSVVGLDWSAPMLALAGRRLAVHEARIRLVETDLERAEGIDVGGPFDAAIAVQSLHHLETERLARVLAWTRARLAPGGWLLVADRVAVPGAAVYPAFRRYKERSGHGRNAATWGGYAADLAGSDDRPQPLDRYLGLLREAGFEAGCLDCRGDRAFLAATAPERSH
jgi:SAM-dependent methyltransferase